MISPRLARALFIPSLLGEAATALVTSRRWWDRIDDVVILGALPTTWHVAQLHDLGVRRVINLCNEYAGPRAAYARHGIEQLRLPTPDFSPPTLDSVRQALALIEQAEAAQESVYLHCKAGRGRSATVAVCRLMQTNSISAEEAEARLRAIRPHVDRRLHRRPVVAAFARTLCDSTPHVSLTVESL